MEMWLDIHFYKGRTTEPFNQIVSIATFSPIELQQSLSFLASVMTNFFFGGFPLRRTCTNSIVFCKWNLWSFPSKVPRHRSHSVSLSFSKAPGCQSSLQYLTLPHRGTQGLVYSLCWHTGCGFPTGKHLCYILGLMWPSVTFLYELTSWNTS